MEPWTFVHLCDTQPGSPKSFRFDPRHYGNWHTARQQVIDLQPDLFLVGGDITRDGSIHNFELQEMKDSFETMNIPYHVIPGNMDTGNKHTSKQGVYSNRNDLDLNVNQIQLDNFKKYFGEFPWSFVHKNVRFSGICDFVVDSKLPEEKKLWKWLDELSQKPPMPIHVMVMHYSLFMDDIHEKNFDITETSEYQDWYFGIDYDSRIRLFNAFKKAKVTTVLSGHIHCRRPEQMVEGISFYKCPATCFGQFKHRWPDGDDSLGFYTFKVYRDNLSPTFVPLKYLSNKEGKYGPTGHPLPNQRDYSLRQIT